MNVYLGHVSIVCGARDNMNGFGQPSSEMRARNPGITVNDVPITHAWPLVTRAAVMSRCSQTIFMSHNNRKVSGKRYKVASKPWLSDTRSICVPLLPRDIAIVATADSGDFRESAAGDRDIDIWHCWRDRPPPPTLHSFLLIFLVRYLSIVCVPFQLPAWTGSFIRKCKFWTQQRRCWNL